MSDGGATPARHGVLSLLAAAREVPDRPALIVDGGVITFGALAIEVRRAIDAIEQRLGLAGSGRPVALTASADVDSLAMLYALVELGVPALLLHPRLAVEERARIVEEANAIAVVRQRSGAEPNVARVSDGAPLADDDRPLAILYTSGTSGRPRGVVLSRAAFVAAAEASAEVLGWRDEDRWLLSLPFAHVGGLSVVLRCLAARRAIVLAPEGSFQADASLAVLARDRVTLASFVPTQLTRLVEHAPPPALRAVLVGGAAASPELLSRALARGWPVRATYGMTEMCSQVATWREDDAANPVDAGVGHPIPGTEVRIVGGEIQVRGPTMMTALFPPGAHPDPRTAGGWLPTGDLGRLDERGRLHVLGRRDHLIISGGENVHPVEVEQALERAAGVLAACVFGVSDAEWGARVCAALVPSGVPVTDDALLAHLDRVLADYQRPRAIAWLPSLPLLANGKIDRACAIALATPQLRALSRRPR